MSFIIYILILFLISCLALYFGTFMFKRYFEVKEFRVFYGNHTFNSMLYYFWIPLEPRYWDNFSYPEIEEDHSIYYGLYLYIKYKILS